MMWIPTNVWCHIVILEDDHLPHFHRAIGCHRAFPITSSESHSWWCDHSPLIQGSRQLHQSQLAANNSRWLSLHVATFCHFLQLLATANNSGYNICVLNLGDPSMTDDRPVRPASWVDVPAWIPHITTMIHAKIWTCKTPPNQELRNSWLTSHFWTLYSYQFLKCSKLLSGLLRKH